MASANSPEWKNKLKVVFLCFGSWKNGLSSYQPYWVKTNPQRFLWAKNQDGKTLDVLSTFGGGNSATSFVATNIPAHFVVNCAPGEYVKTDVSGGCRT